jgi:hypothetical protein
MAMTSGSVPTLEVRTLYSIHVVVKLRYSEKVIKLFEKISHFFKRLLSNVRTKAELL